MPFLRSLVPRTKQPPMDPTIVEIDQALHVGDVKRAHFLLEDEEKFRELEQVQKIILIAKKAELYFLLGKYEEAENHANNVVNEGTNGEKTIIQKDKQVQILFLLAKIDSKIVKGQINVKKGNLDSARLELNDCKESLKSILKLGKKAKNPLRIEIKKRSLKTDFLHGIILQKKGEMEAALDMFLKIKNSLEELNLPINTTLLNALGITYSLVGKTKEALDCFKKSVAILENLDNTLDLIRAYNNLGQILWQSHRYEDALKYYLKCLDLSNRMSSMQHSAIIMLNIGLIQWSLGNLDESLEYFEKSLESCQQLGMEAHVSLCLNNIGNIYTQKGNLDKALKCYHEALQIASKHGQRKEIASYLNNIGILYFEKGKYTAAEEYLTKCLELQKQLNDDVNASETIFNLIFVSQVLSTQQSNKEYGEKMTSWLNELEELVHKNQDNQTIDWIYRFAKAFLLVKNTRRFHQLLEAHRTLSEIVEQQLSNVIILQAIRTLGELKLLELGMSEDESEILNELNMLISLLFEFAKEQNSYLTLIDAYLLQAKLLLIEFKIDEARQILQKAQDFAEEKGLTMQAMMISAEHDKILDQLDEWNNLVHQDASVMQRIELAELEPMFFSHSTALQKEVQEKQEEPILFLIISDHGLSLYSKSFLEDQNFSELLISGFITAINAMSSEILSEHGSLERIKHDKYTLLLNATDRYLFCYAFQGPSYFASKKIHQIVNELKKHEEIWAKLKESYLTSHQLSVERENTITNIITKIIRTN